MATFKSIMNRWRTGDFFRQLATVVIGIIITFGGNSLIQRGSERKEARNILQMVRNELQSNIYEIRGYQEFLKSDIEGSRVMRPYLVDGTPENIPIDTLEKYVSVLVSSTTYKVITNSFETLQSSPMMKVIDNSELMNALFGIYDTMDECQLMTERFMERKYVGSRNILDKLDPKTTDTFFTPEGVLNTFIFMAKNDAGALLRNYIISVARGNNNYQVAYADEIIAEIEKVMHMVDKEIK